MSETGIELAAAPSPMRGRFVDQDSGAYFGGRKRPPSRLREPVTDAISQQDTCIVGRWGTFAWWACRTSIAAQLGSNWPRPAGFSGIEFLALWLLLRRVWSDENARRGGGGAEMERCPLLVK